MFLMSLTATVSAAKALLYAGITLNKFETPKAGQIGEQKGYIEQSFCAYSE